MIVDDTGWWSVSITISERFHLQPCGKREKILEDRSVDQFPQFLRNESVFFRNKPRMPFGSSASITIKFPWNWITNFPLKFLLPSLLIERRSEEEEKKEENRKCISRIELSLNFYDFLIITIPSDFSWNRWKDRFNPVPSLSSPFLIPTPRAVDVFHFANPYLEFHRFLSAWELNWTATIRTNIYPICLRGWSYSCYFLKNRYRYPCTTYVFHHVVKIDEQKNGNADQWREKREEDSWSIHKSLGLSERWIHRDDKREIETDRDNERRMDRIVLDGV